MLARRPLTGERDLRSEDRQLLLDAVLAATETLVVTYTGANEHTGAARPPAVPLGELLDAARPHRSRAGARHVLVRHPLQPYDARNLMPGALVGDRRRSASTGPRSPVPGPRRGAASAPPFLAAHPLPAAPTATSTWPTSSASCVHPVRAFLRQRLDCATPLDADEIDDAIPVDLDALEQWEVGDRLLREVLAGQDRGRRCSPPSSCAAPAARAGSATRALGQVVQEAQAARTPAPPRCAQRSRRSLDVDVDLGGGRRLTGTVAERLRQRAGVASATPGSAPGSGSRRGSTCSP